MAINPNIILSGNQMAAPQLPDVNAMMQTRTAGMENIYAIEQQRAAQAQAAQKEQEAEAMKALSPAIAAAFSDPSDAGLDAALALVPPQYQGAAKAQLDQIRALPDPNRRKDLIRAGLVQDEAGRTLLGQLEMTAAQRANFDIQRGQLEVSRAKAAREVAAANQPPQMTPYQAEMIKLAQAKEAREAAATETPKIKSDKARSKVDDTLSEMMLSYNKLKQEGAIVSTEASGLENVIARGGAALGTTAGRAIGTKAQTERDFIQSLRMDLIRDIKTATGMSAQELNSNFELQAALDALSDPYGQSFETALRTIAKISQSYGKGGVAATIDAAARGKSDLQPAPAGTATGRIPQITSDEEFDALPSGAEFIDPEGVRRRKP